MSTIETRRRIAELKIKKNALTVRMQKIRHQSDIVDFALEAFKGEVRIAKIPLRRLGADRLRSSLATFKKLVPERFHGIADVAERLNEVEPYIPIPLVPILEGLRGDLKKELATAVIEEAKLNQDIARLEKA
jgi:hypothetical protein